MAVAAFWDVFELRMKVFGCLRDDRCDADLARCARVHYTWTDLALNALWLGYPRTQGNDSDSNVKRTEAIALLPRDRRQAYASRFSVLDFSKLGGTCRLVHAMFDGLDFPRLKEVILNNVENSMREGLRLSKYLQPTLESLKLVDRSYEDERNWLTASFLADAAERCPGLKEVSFCIPYANFEPRDLTQFLRSIRPQMVSLDFGESTSEILTLDLLRALSHGGCLESLAFAPSQGEFTHIKVDHLQSFFDATRNPFPSLKRLDIALDSRAVPWIPQCFPMVTWLRMEI